MTLFKNAAGIYEGDFRRKGLRRLHLSMRTTKRGEGRARHDAVQRLFRESRVAMIAQLRRGVLTVERLETMVRHGEPLVPLARPKPKPAAQCLTWGTVDQAVKRYLDWLKAHPRRSTGTHKAARTQLRRLTTFVVEGTPLGARPFDGVTSADIQALQQSFVAAGTPANTITVTMGRVGTLWRWAASQEARAAREERRPARPLYSPVDPEQLVRESTRRDRVLSRAEVERLLAATPEPLLCPIACALLAGLRLGEVLHLRPGLDVDLEAGTLAVRDQPTWRPKTRRSRRVIPIAENLRPALERHLLRWASDMWLCASYASPRAPLHEITLRRELKVIVERAGMVYGRRDPQGVTFHTLRHTFASTAVMRGVDLYTVAQLLGDSLKMVEDVYAHLSPDFKRAAIAKVASAFQLPEVATT